MGWSPALQADSLPAEPPGQPIWVGDTFKFSKKQNKNISRRKQEKNKTIRESIQQVLDKVERNKL